MAFFCWDKTLPPHFIRSIRIRQISQIITRRHGFTVSSGRTNSNQIPAFGFRQAIIGSKHPLTHRWDRLRHRFVQANRKTGLAYGDRLDTKRDVSIQSCRHQNDILPGTAFLMYKTFEIKLPHCATMERPNSKCTICPGLRFNFPETP